MNTTGMLHRAPEENNNRQAAGTGWSVQLHTGEETDEGICSEEEVGSSEELHSHRQERHFLCYQQGCRETAWKYRPS